MTIFNIIRWVAGTNDSSTKCLMFQVQAFLDYGDCGSKNRVNRGYLVHSTKGEENKIEL